MVYQGTSRPVGGISFARSAQVPLGHQRLILRRMSPLTASSEAQNLLRWWRTALPVLVVAALLCLGLANVVSLATWGEVEDGVLWASRSEGVVAAEIAARTPAAAVGLKPGDLLLAIDDQPVQEVDDVLRALHREDAGSTLRYTV